jgi:dTDP-4-amino-4,6-dideoxygalactose transaminase
MVERAVTPRTKAIAVTHLYGSVCDMDGINAVAKRHGLYVVEDSAHQHGTMFKGKKTGALGDAASFSLQNSKPFTCGEGGVITTDDDARAERLDALRNCGRRPVKREIFEKNTGNYVIEGNFIQSGNYRLTEFQAAVLLGQLEKLPGQIRAREENALYLRSLLESVKGVKNTRRQDGTELQAYFNFAFRYDKDAFGGLSVQKFREALSAELNFPFTASYQPLTNCDLYRPLTKKRHKIGEEFHASIDPSRFSAPVAERVFLETSVCAHHAFLLGTRSDMEDVAEAIEKIRANVGEIE